MNNLKILFIILFVPFFSEAQTIENWITANEKNPVEKIYLHTDAENYFIGDTAWFKVYLIDSRSGQLISGAENVYVSFIDQSGKSVLDLILLCINGQASGSFVISDQLKPGNYLFQAYTNYLFNFKSDAQFYKQVSVSRVSGFTRQESNKNRVDNMIADIAFLPEGGALLEGITNLVAFKAISRLGYGVNARGTVKDNNGFIVASFTTDYKGMGLFFLTPEPGKSYYATVDGFPAFRYKFEPVKVGGKIQLINHTAKEAIVNVAVNSEKLVDGDFYLVNMFRGEVLFYKEFKMDGANKVFKIENSSLKPGINKLVLLDKTLTPVSERLLFLENFEMNNLLVQTDAGIYNKRAEIQLQISDENFLKEEDYSNLSVLVVHEFVVPEKGFSKNILSQYLIDSEISGFIESSADLFVDTEISSEAKLRLVMLTNGYGSYFWNNAPHKFELMNYKQEAGISLKGAAKNTLTGNKVANGKITIAIQKEDEIAFLTQTTDSMGNFIFPGLIFNDTATVHIQGKNEAGKMNMDIDIEPAFRNTEANDVHVKLLSELSNDPSKLAGLKYQLAMENKKNAPKSNIGKSKNEANGSGKLDGYFRLYKTADFVLDVEPFEQSYSNVLDFMVGKVPGVDINGDDVRIRGASGFGNGSLPLFLIDGVPLSGNQVISFPGKVARNSVENERGSSNVDEQLIQTVRAIPISDVEKIEVLKSPQNLAAFGVKGANGVIAIYTRRGELNTEYATTKSIIKNRIVGYSKYRQFYSPKYLPDDLTEKRHSLNTLLYWNPEVKTKDGFTALGFFSSDLPGKYNVFVEGIANDGKICLGTAQFEVK